MNKAAPTKKQRDERARRIAMGIAVIQRPLRFIRARHTAGSDRMKNADIAANRGNGGLVKSIARSVA